MEGPLEDILFRVASPHVRDAWERPFERALYVLVKERKFGAGCVDAWERDHDAPSVARQAVASVASGDRTGQLRALDLPTLVVHGLADTICDPSGGRATAAAIPGAELLLIEGMGHNLPPGLWDRLADAIAANVRRGQARARAEA